MSSEPDPDKLAKRTVEILGGTKRASQIIDDELSAIRQRWDQDIILIGRVLRAHLFVEHYLTEYLEKANPKLGSQAKARLSFGQKAALLNPIDVQIVELLPGILHLNAIRNRLAHQLSITLTQKDSKIFLGAKMFKALRDEGAKPGKPNDDPIEVMEKFALHVGVMMAAPGAFSRAFTQALHESHLGNLE